MSVNNGIWASFGIAKKCNCVDILYRYVWLLALFDTASIKYLPISWSTFLSI